MKERVLFNKGLEKRNMRHERKRERGGENRIAGIHAAGAIYVHLTARFEALSACADNAHY